MPLETPAVTARTWLFGLRICVSVTLAARGWLTMRWDSPIRSVAWNEDWWARPLESIAGISWEKIALESDPILSRIFDVVGLFLLLAAILLWFLRGRTLGILLVTATLILLLDSLGRWIASGHQFGMAIEHALQIFAPIALLRLPGSPASSHRWVMAVLIASAMTFAGHGFHAAGLHPVPLSYQTMTMKLLSVGRENAILLLSLAGWLDLLVAATVFVPRLRKISLAYMAAWGGLTALARIVSHLGLELPLYGLDPWLAETLVRTPHWLFPILALFLLAGFREDNGNTAPG